MMLENGVVDAVADFLGKHGWTIESVAHAHQRGNDIVATKEGVRLLVERKEQEAPMLGRSGTAFPLQGTRLAPMSA
jgi:hypothetical protein